MYDPPTGREKNTHTRCSSHPISHLTNNCPTPHTPTKAPSSAAATAGGASTTTPTSGPGPPRRRGVGEGGWGGGFRRRIWQCLPRTWIWPGGCRRGECARVWGCVVWVHVCVYVKPTNKTNQPPTHPPNNTPPQSSTSTKPITNQILGPPHHHKTNGPTSPPSHPPHIKKTITNQGLGPPHTPAAGPAGPERVRAAAAGGAFGGGRRGGHRRDERAGGFRIYYIFDMLYMYIYLCVYKGYV